MLKNLIYYCFVNIVLIVLLIDSNNAKFCGDPECKSTIAIGLVLLNSPGDTTEHFMRKDEEVDILAMQVGSKKEDYIVRLKNGDERIATKYTIMEKKVIINSKSRINVDEVNNIAPTPPKHVIDGTTIAYNEIPGTDTPDLVAIPANIQTSKANRYSKNIRDEDAETAAAKNMLDVHQPPAVVSINLEENSVTSSESFNSFENEIDYDTSALKTEATMDLEESNESFTVSASFPDSSKVAEGAQVNSHENEADESKTSNQEKKTAAKEEPTKYVSNIIVEQDHENPSAEITNETNQKLETNGPVTSTSADTKTGSVNSTEQLNNLDPEKSKTAETAQNNSNENSEEIKGVDGTKPSSQEKEPAEPVEQYENPAAYETDKKVAQIEPATSTSTETETDSANSNGQLNNLDSEKSKTAQNNSNENSEEIEGVIETKISSQEKEPVEPVDQHENPAAFETNQKLAQNGPVTSTSTDTKTGSANSDGQLNNLDAESSKTAEGAQNNSNEISEEIKGENGTKISSQEIEAAGHVEQHHENTAAYDSNQKLTQNGPVISTATETETDSANSNGQLNNLDPEKSKPAETAQNNSNENSEEIDGVNETKTSSQEKEPAEPVETLNHLKVETEAFVPDIEPAVTDSLTDKKNVQDENLKAKVVESSAKNLYPPSTPVENVTPQIPLNGNELDNETNSVAPNEHIQTERITAGDVPGVAVVNDNYYNESSSDLVDTTIETNIPIATEIPESKPNIMNLMGHRNVIDMMKASTINSGVARGEEKHVEGDHLLSTNNADSTYCDQTSCPKATANQKHSNGFQHPLITNQRHQVQSQDNEMSSNDADSVDSTMSENDMDTDYVKLIVMELLGMSDLIIYLGMTACTLIIFLLGHSCINRNRKEKPLIYKLNMIERDLMASHKENAILKNDLSDTKNKLVSIENNSFGSNDMVVALKHELEDEEHVKNELQEQIVALERELETAAEAGLELNRMVAELLNQSGSDSIALTVDELQKQLNEQQDTIMSMNTTLAAKSRENSELQILLSNQSGKFNDDYEYLQQNYNDLKLEKSNIEIELNNLKANQETRSSEHQQKYNAEINRLNNEIKALQSKNDNVKKSLSTSDAKIEALEECIKEIKIGSTNGTIDGLIDSAQLKADLLVLNREKSNLQERLQGEIIARQLLDDHVKIINEEISALKKEYSQSEKEKLEAATRLEVLSTYFKDKETQLQKELSIKEAKWMQSQGETTTTVERIRSMQDEIQTLKSQNDALRAEIEAQSVAHKAQNAALDTRAHDAWLNARQAERRLEETRTEASALRRKLTALGDVSVSDSIPNELNMNMNAVSPLRVESPNSPRMGVMQIPFIPPPFMGAPPPPFMSQHFMPPGEMRPPPLGRLMSPPPPPNRYSPSIIDDRDRYSPDRGRYSPDSRYNYSVISNYETETDFSPPPSPPHARHSNYRDRDHRDGRGSGNGGYNKAYSPPPPPHSHRTSPPIQDARNNKYKGGFSSGSQDSIGNRKGGKYKKLST